MTPLLAALKILAQADAGATLPLSTVLDYVHNAGFPDEDINKDALRQGKADGLIESQYNSITKQTRYWITPAGRIAHSGTRA